MRLLQIRVPGLARAPGGKTRAPGGASRSGGDPRSHADAARTAAPAALPRRTVLRTSGAAVLGGTALAAVGAGTAGCALGDREQAVDPLQALADQAVADADLARRLAAASPDHADAVSVIIDERRAHADALTAEIHRAAGTTPAPEARASPSDGADGTSTPAPPSPPPPPPTLDELRTALAASQRAAANTVHGLDGYRAGLAGAVSAACAAEQKVLLP